MEEKLAEIEQKLIAKGKELALLEVAKNMSANGCSMELISQVTGLSMADIKCVLD